MSDDMKIEPFTMKYVCGCSLTFESAPPSSPRIFRDGRLSVSVVCGSGQACSEFHTSLEGRIEPLHRPSRRRINMYLLTSCVIHLMTDIGSENGIYTSLFWLINCSRHTLKHYLGCSGWSQYQTWAKDFYSNTLDPEGYVAYYSRIFDFVEVYLNSIVSRLTIKKWAKQTPDNFRLH